MNELADFVAETWDTLRIGSSGQWLLRLVLLGSVLGAVALSWWWAGSVFAFAFAVFAALLGVATVFKPDSLAVGAFLVTIIGWWLFAGGGQPWWQMAAMALLLQVVHLVSAATGTAPLYARWSTAALRRVTGSVAIVMGLTAPAVAVVIAAAALPSGWIPRGLGWIVALIVVVLSAAVWAARRRGVPPE